MPDQLRADHVARFDEVRKLLALVLGHRLEDGTVRSLDDARLVLPLSGLQGRDLAQHSVAALHPPRIRPNC